MTSEIAKFKMEVTDDFNAIDFEQRLTNLKDTQDSIQAMSAWCLKHRPNHKKVVSSWLNVLKQGNFIIYN